MLCGKTKFLGFKVCTKTKHEHKPGKQKQNTNQDTACIKTHTQTRTHTKKKKKKKQPENVFGGLQVFAGDVHEGKDCLDNKAQLAIWSQRSGNDYVADRLWLDGDMWHIKNSFDVTNQTFVFEYRMKTDDIAPMFVITVHKTNQKNKNIYVIINYLKENLNIKYCFDVVSKKL